MFIQSSELAMRRSDNVNAEVNTTQKKTFEETLSANPHTLNWLMQKALHFTKHKNDAEDLANDTLIDVMCAWDSYDDTRPLSEWLFIIMRNRFLSNCRGKARRRFDAAIKNSTALENVAAQDPQTTEIVTVNDAKNQLPAELSEALYGPNTLVSTENADIFVTVYVLDKSHQEVAEAYGISRDGVVSILEGTMSLLRSNESVRSNSYARRLIQEKTSEVESKNSVQSEMKKRRDLLCPSSKEVENAIKYTRSELVKMFLSFFIRGTEEVMRRSIRAHYELMQAHRSDYRTSFNVFILNIHKVLRPRGIELHTKKMRTSCSSSEDDRLSLRARGGNIHILDELPADLPIKHARAKVIADTANHVQKPQHLIRILHTRYEGVWQNDAAVALGCSREELASIIEETDELLAEASMCIHLRHELMTMDATYPIMRIIDTPETRESLFGFTIKVARYRIESYNY